MSSRSGPGQSGLGPGETVPGWSDLQRLEALGLVWNLGPVPYSLVAGFSMLLHALSLRHGRTPRQQKKSE